MGIYDRDYYRDEETSGWGDWAGCRASLLLSALLTFAFVAAVFADGGRRGGLDPDDPGRVADALGFRADRIADGQVWRFATSHFVHARQAFFQVALFVAAILVVGTRVEQLHSTREYLAFLLVAGGTVSLAKLVVAYGTGDVRELTYGAGGLVSAVLALYVCHHPHERITLFVPVPVWLVAAAVIGLDLLGEFGGRESGSGRVAHLAGVAAGVVYYSTGVRVSNWLFPRRLAAAPTPTRSPVGGVPADPTPARVAVAPSDEQLEARVDEILDKVSRTGRESLTDEERETLQRASELFQRRRRPNR